MAYLKVIYPPRCIECRGPATDELCNWRNEHMAYYCHRHAVLALRTTDERERREEGYPA